MPSTERVSRPSPARVFVPVRRGGSAVVLRTYSDPLGRRTGVGFTDVDSLRDVLGGSVEFVELGVTAWRTLLAASGTDLWCIDPRLSAAIPARPGTVPTADPSRGSRTSGSRLEGFAA